jgi:hypothetical protein
MDDPGKTARSRARSARARGYDAARLRHHPSECRLTILGAATCQRVHVAPPGRARRHMRSSMSLQTIGSGDMLRSTCRSRRLGRATRSTAHVAPGERVERRCRRCVSHCTRT